MHAFGCASDVIRAPRIEWRDALVRERGKTFLNPDSIKPANEPHFRGAFADDNLRCKECFRAGAELPLHDVREEWLLGGDDFRFPAFAMNDLNIINRHLAQDSRGMRRHEILT